MAKFNLNDYDQVDVRIRQLYKDYPDCRVITENLTTLQDRQASTWVVKAYIYLDEGSQAAGLPKATGHAFEVDGGEGANKTAALENAETSAIGRALANMNMSGNKRASREEMAKAEREITPQAPTGGWWTEADRLVESGDLNALRALYGQAEASGVPATILKGISDRANGLKVASDTAG